MTDRYRLSSGPTTNGRRGVVLTPAASDLTGGIAKAVVALTAGDVTLVPADNDNGDTLSFVNVPAGWVSPFQVRRVTAATATVAAIYD